MNRTPDQIRSAGVITAEPSLLRDLVHQDLTSVKCSNALVLISEAEILRFNVSSILHKTAKCQKI